MVKKGNIILDKSFHFAVRIYNLAKYLREKSKEYYLADQILRSGTSISANMHEANVGQSKKDFYTKLSISLKEAQETEFWIKLIYKVNLISQTEYLSMSSDCFELIKILSKIRATTKQTLH